MTRWLSPALAVAVLGLWELAARARWIDVVLTSMPSRIVAASTHLFDDGAFVADVGYSLGVFASAVLLATVFGTALGLAMGHSAIVHALVHPFVVAFNALPKVALMPLVVLWVGIGRPAGMLLATVMASFPILLSTSSGLRSLERDHVAMARAFGAPPRLLLQRVILPGVTPSVLSGLGVGIQYALVGVILAEFFASSQGLGYRMVAAMQNFEVDAFFVCLTVVAAVALSCASLVRLAQRRVQAWQPDAFAPVRGL